MENRVLRKEHSAVYFYTAKDKLCERLMKLYKEREENSRLVDICMLFGYRFFVFV